MGFRILSLEFRNWSFMVPGFGFAKSRYFTGSVFDFRDRAMRFCVSGLGSRVSSFGFRVSDFKFRVLGLPGAR